MEFETLCPRSSVVKVVAVVTTCSRCYTRDLDTRDFTRMCAPFVCASCIKGMLGRLDTLVFGAMERKNAEYADGRY